MQRVPIHLAQVGMVLAKTVERDDGLVLCGKGTKLSEPLLDKLKELHIPAVIVEGKPLDLGEEEQTPQEMEEKLHLRFRRVENNPLMMALKEIFRQRIWARAAEESREEPPEGS